MGWRAAGGGLNFYWGFSAGIGGAFILVGGAGRWAVVLWVLGTFLVFHNLLGS